MKIIVVATHNERFFDSFIDSCHKQNIEPIILGWGHKYTGHLMKDDLLQDYLQNNLNNNEIILFCDAFDCLLIRNVKELENKFVKSKHDMVISTEYFSNTIYNKIKNFYFINNNGEKSSINTGMIIGYKWAFLKMLSEVKKHREPRINSNQRIWNITLNESKIVQKMNIKKDANNNFFKNYNLFTHGVKIQNNKLICKYTNSEPYVIQGNANTNLNKICDHFNIKKSEVKMADKIKYIKAYIYYYWLPYINIIIPVILVLIAIIIVFLKPLNKRN